MSYSIFQNARYEGGADFYTEGREKLGLYCDLSDFINKITLTRRKLKARHYTFRNRGNFLVSMCRSGPGVCKVDVDKGSLS